MSSSIWLYGSVARGDSDDLSDIDVLVAGDESVDWRKAVAADRALNDLTDGDVRLSAMEFGWSELKAMARYGSLFLHHIKLEGRPLAPTDDDPLAALLEELPHYQRAGQEIRAFAIVLHDVAMSIRGHHSPPFELAVIATALRHAFILGCYVTGQPEFGRIKPFRRLSSELALSPYMIQKLENLYQFRLHQQGRAPVPFSATTMDVREWLRAAASLFTAIQRRVDEFDRAMLGAGQSCA